MTGWPIGSVMDSDQNLIDELANVYGIRFTKAIKQAEYKFGAVELVNGDLVDGRLKILKGSPLEKQMQTLQWKPDDFGNNREDKAQANHSTDCLIYARRLVAHLFEIGSVHDDAPRKSEAYKDPQGLDDGEPAREDPLLSGTDWGEVWG